MTDTLSNLEADLAALRKVRAMGAKVVRYRDGRSTEFRSDTELAAAIDDLLRRVAALSSPGPIATVRFATSKGL
jgi:hypothetical protein